MLDIRSERLSRTQMILGQDFLDYLKQTEVAVFGLGGVGSACVEALVRGGIGTIHIIDHDTVSLSNLNRQLLSEVSVIGMLKTDAMEKRIAGIAPDVNVFKYPLFYLPESSDRIDLSGMDYVIDCIDNITAKLHLAQTCVKQHINIISSMGTGNRVDPQCFRIGDIYETSNDGLARIMRKELRKRKIQALSVLYSTESPQNIKTRIPGSVSFVPPVAGMILAGQVINRLYNQFIRQE